MLILTFQQQGPFKFRATIQHEGAVQELSIVVHVEKDVRGFELENASRSLMQLIHNSAYSRPFSFYFWQFYAGRKLSFPIDLSSGSQQWAEAARA